MRNLQICQLTACRIRGASGAGVCQAGYNTAPVPCEESLAERFCMAGGRRRLRYPVRVSGPNGSGNRPLHDSVSARLESGGGGGPGPAGLHRGARQPGQRLGSGTDRDTGGEAVAGHEGVTWRSGGLPRTTSRSLRFPTLPDDGSSLPRLWNGAGGEPSVHPTVLVDGSVRRNAGRSCVAFR